MSPLEQWRRGRRWSRSRLVEEVWVWAGAVVTDRTISRWEDGSSFPGVTNIVALKRIGAETALQEMISWLS